RLAKETQSSFSTDLRWAYQRRLMFVTRIKQKSCSSFNHATKAQLFQQRAGFCSFILSILCVGIEDTLIQGDGQAAVAQLGQNGQSIFQPMMREAVGVVPEKHNGNIQQPMARGHKPV